MGFRKAAEPHQAILIFILGLVTFSFILFGIVSVICGTIVGFSQFSGKDLLCKIPHAESVFASEDEEDVDIFGVSLASKRIDANVLALDFKLDNLARGILPGAGLCTADVGCYLGSRMLPPYSNKVYRTVYAGTYPCEVPVVPKGDDPIFQGESEDLKFTARVSGNCMYTETVLENNTVVVSSEDIVEQQDGTKIHYLLDPVNFAVYEDEIKDDEIALKVAKINNPNHDDPVTISVTGMTSRGFRKILMSDVMDWDSCSDYVCESILTFPRGDSAKKCGDTLAAFLSRSVYEINKSDNSIVISDDSSGDFVKENVILSKEDVLNTSLERGKYFYQVFKVGKDTNVKGVFVFGRVKESYVGSGSLPKVNIDVYDFTTGDTLYSGSIPVSEVFLSEFEFPESKAVSRGDVLLLRISSGDADLEIYNSFLNNDLLSFMGYNKTDSPVSDLGSLDISTDQMYYLYPILDDTDYKFRLNLLLNSPYSSLDIYNLTVNLTSNLIDSRDSLQFKIKFGDSEEEHTMDCTLYQGELSNVYCEFDPDGPVVIPSPGEIEIVFDDLRPLEVPVFTESDEGVVSGPKLAFENILFSTPIVPNMSIGMGHYPLLECYTFKVYDGGYVSDTSDVNDVVTFLKSEKDAEAKVSDSPDGKNIVYIDEGSSISVDDLNPASKDYFFTYIYSQLFGENYGYGVGGTSEILYLDYSNQKVIYEKSPDSSVDEKALVAALVWATGKVVS